MSAVEVKAARIAPPRSGRVQRISYTTSATATELDSDFPGRWVTLKNTGGGTVYVLFGDSTAEVDSSASSGATLGWPIAGGETESFELDTTQTHLAHQGDSAGDLYLAQSSV